MKKRMNRTPKEIMKAYHRLMVRRAAKYSYVSLLGGEHMPYVGQLRRFNKFLCLEV